MLLCLFDEAKTSRVMAVSRDDHGP
jgi:hypothetical protein